MATVCTTPERRSARHGVVFLVSAAVYFIVYVVARALLEAEGLGAATRVAISVAPLPPFVVMLWHFIRNLQNSDELERRIQLEALAVAFPLSVLLVMTLGLLELAVPLNPADWSYRHIWPFLCLFYFLGIVVARRRYA